jgi:GT2 family glycosyltransferase
LNGQAKPSLTIGIVPRERFSVAARSLKALFQYTDLDFELVVVDNCAPPRYWSEIERVLAGRPNVRIIRTESILMPGPCKELIANLTTTDLTCFLENDVFVTRNWLAHLLAAMVEHPAEVVVPMVMEGSPHKIHADMNMGHFDFQKNDEGTALDIVPIEITHQFLDSGSLAELDVAETHCMLFRTEVLHRLKPFAEALNTREFIDTCLTLHRAGIPIILQPASRVIFTTPPPVESDELAFFQEKWNYELAAQSHQRIRDKWNLVSIPESLAFIRERQHRINRRRWLMYTITTRVPRRASRMLRSLLRSRVGTRRG